MNLFDTVDRWLQTEEDYKIYFQILKIFGEMRAVDNTDPTETFLENSSRAAAMRNLEPYISDKFRAKLSNAKIVDSLESKVGGHRAATSIAKLLIKKYIKNYPDAYEKAFQDTSQVFATYEGGTTELNFFELHIVLPILGEVLYPFGLNIWRDPRSQEFLSASIHLGGKLSPAAMALRPKIGCVATPRSSRS